MHESIFGNSIRNNTSGISNTECRETAEEEKRRRDLLIHSLQPYCSRTMPKNKGSLQDKNIIVLVCMGIKLDSVRVS